MLKFGAITIDTSHPKSFAKKLAAGESGRYVAVYNNGFRGEDEVNAFAEFNDLKVCNTLEELADMVDIGIAYLSFDLEIALDLLLRTNVPLIVLIERQGYCKGRYEIESLSEIDRRTDRLALIESDAIDLHRARVGLLVDIDRYSL